MIIYFEHVRSHLFCAIKLHDEVMTSENDYFGSKQSQAGDVSPSTLSFIGVPEDVSKKSRSFVVAKASPLLAGSSEPASRESTQLGIDEEEEPENGQEQHGIQHGITDRTDRWDTILKFIQI